MKIKATILCVLLAASLAQGADVKFTAAPSVTKAGAGAKVTFTVSRPTDVEVAVLDTKGNVVRHLAAGVLGAKKAPPKPLRPGLSQALVWDGKDDLGRRVVGGGCTVRVRAGMQVKFGKILGDPATLIGSIYGLATDERGQVYVANGGGYGGKIFTIKVFDRDGKYLRTIMPFPAHLKPADVSGFGAARLLDGKLTPRQYNSLLPQLYPNSLGGFIGNTVRNDVLWVTNGRGQICRVRASDGAAISWGKGKAPARPAQGPICWAPSPDGKTLYLAGWYWWFGSRKNVPDGQVFKVNPATGERTPFIKIDVPAKSYWLIERNGWYHYTNWGRKNGMSALHGLATDKEGRLYVCDRVNHRVAVYDRAGKLLGSTPVRWPDHVALSPKGPEIYVTTRKIIDGYKAINEVKVLKLSGWKNGRVLAALTLKGHQAPSMAVDATSAPTVVWLTNVGKGGGITRIEDRDGKFVVTGTLNEKIKRGPGVAVKVWADPQTDDVIVSDGWSRLTRVNGVTGQVLPFPIRGMDLCFGRDGNIYVYGQRGWHELVTRFNRNFKPVAFPATKKNTTTMTTTGKDVYGRYGHGWSNKGLFVGPKGRIYVYNMYDWSKYFVNVWDATGRAEKHNRAGDGLIGPLDTQGGGLRVDWQGNVYVGMHGFPRNHPSRSRLRGSVVKFPPTGGGYVKKAGALPGIPWKGSQVGRFVEGGIKAYPGLASQVDRGCVCKAARFDLDGYGRLYIPNVFDFRVRVVDNNGNEVMSIGHYGNADSCGPDSAVPDPAIPLGWPISVSAAQIHKGRIYVADTLNHRVVRVDVIYAAEQICELK